MSLLSCLCSFVTWRLRLERSIDCLKGDRYALAKKRTTKYFSSRINHHHIAIRCKCMDSLILDNPRFADMKGEELGKRSTIVSESLVRSFLHFSWCFARSDFLANAVIALIIPTLMFQKSLLGIGIDIHPLSNMDATVILVWSSSSSYRLATMVPLFNVLY